MIVHIVARAAAGLYVSESIQAFRINSTFKFVSFKLLKYKQYGGADTTKAVLEIWHPVCFRAPNFALFPEAVSFYGEGQLQHLAVHLCIAHFLLAFEPAAPPRSA